MSSLLALLYLICNRSRRLVRSLICSQDLRNLYSTMYNDSLGSLQELSDMIVYKCMNQLKMILSGDDALYIYFTFTLCQI